MTALAPNLFNRRFGDLVQEGLSLLPSLAPGWTDYNTHDPGITLMELLAWVAEAQMYSLARMRRDERIAYAALLGIVPSGPTPATGLVWPDRNDPNSPSLRYQESLVIDTSAAVRVAIGQMPTFHPTHTILWVPGSVRRLRTRLASGPLVDLTAKNSRGDRVFEPFGPRAGPRDELLLDFVVNGVVGLFPAKRSDADGACLAVGVRADAPAVAGPASTSAVVNSSARGGSLTATLAADGRRTPLPVIDDGTDSFLRTGVVLLDVSGVAGSPTEFTLEFRAPKGFERPPRLFRIDLSVLPIVQDDTIVREAYPALGTPDQQIILQTSGLRFGPDVPAVRVEVGQASGTTTTWSATTDLQSAGPEDAVYQLDPVAGTVSFGNGVNGRIAAPPSQVLVTYPVCQGAQGNTLRSQYWSVSGIDGLFGPNLDTVTGGQDAPQDEDRRREARLVARATQTLVTGADINAAALAIPDLEVARAFVPPMTVTTAPNAPVTLIALRARSAADDPSVAPESSRWLAQVWRSLVDRLPLGTRLAVRAPDYVSFTISAQLIAAAKVDPATVQAAVIQRLKDKLSLVQSADGESARDFGASVSRLDVAVWIRNVPGVKTIQQLQLLDASGTAQQQILVSARGLPLLTATPAVVVSRPAGASA